MRPTPRREPPARPSSPARAVPGAPPASFLRRSLRAGALGVAGSIAVVCAAALAAVLVAAVHRPGPGAVGGAGGPHAAPAPDPDGAQGRGDARAATAARDRSGPEDDAANDGPWRNDGAGRTEDEPENGSEPPGEAGPGNEAGLAHGDRPASEGRESSEDRSPDRDEPATEGGASPGDPAPDEDEPATEARTSPEDPPANATRSAGEGTSAGAALLAALRGLEIERDPEGGAWRPTLEPVWNVIHRLRGEYPGYEREPWRALEGKLSGLPPVPRFAAAALVISTLPRRERDLRAEAETALRRLAREAGLPALRAASAGLLARQGDPESFANRAAIRRALEAAEAPRVRIACALALWHLDRDRSDLLPVLPYLDAPSFALRAEAALALAEAGGLRPEGPLRAKVQRILGEIEIEPGPRGERARRLRAAGSSVAAGPRLPGDADLARRVEELEARLREANAEGASGDAVQSLIALLRRRYVDPSRLRERELWLEAARGLVESADEHASLLGPEALEADGGLDGGRYAGLGARFGKPDPEGPLVVLRPLYNGPAWREDAPPEERLLTGDRVLEVDGVPTAPLPVGELRLLLAGDGSEAPTALLVARGDSPPREIRLRRGPVEVPDILGALVRPSVAYLRLRRFDGGTARRARRELDALAERAGALEGLVLDLRDNPGGRLDEAVGVVDLLVSGEDETRPVVTEERLDGGPPIHHLPTAERRFAGPVAVLVDERTMSAAEVVAGSLQAYGRAIVVGRRTYGKGVSQETIDVPAALRRRIGGPARIRLPTHYLVLPQGARFHRVRPAETGGATPRTGGIRPDVRVPSGDDAGAPVPSRGAVERLQYAAPTTAWLHAHPGQVEALAAEAPPGPEELPGLEGLRAKLAAELGAPPEPERLLVALVRLARRFREDRAGRELPPDPGTDPALGAALERLGATSDGSDTTAARRGEPDESPEGS